MNKLQAIAYIYRFHNMTIPRMLEVSSKSNETKH